MEKVVFYKENFFITHDKARIILRYYMTKKDYKDTSIFKIKIESKELNQDSESFWFQDKDKSAKKLVQALCTNKITPRCLLEVIDDCKIEN